MDAVKAQAKQGSLVNVSTPTLFANGKLMERGQMVPVLQAVLKHWSLKDYRWMTLTIHVLIIST